MDPRGIYKQSRPQAWTRVDMLLELYRAVMRHTSAALELLEKGEQLQARIELFRGARVIGGLKAGLDLQQGELPRKLDQLFDYALDCFAAAELPRVASAQRVLKTLQESFEEIRGEAIALEKSGQIPPLSIERMMAVMA